MNKDNDKRSFLDKVFAKTFGSKPVAATGTPAVQANISLPAKQVDPNDITGVLHELESTFGKSPMTPGYNERRSGVVPGANMNEKARPFKYQVGYGGEFGITPDAVANLLKSEVDKNSPQNKQGYTGFKRNYDLPTIQKMLLENASSSGALAKDYFLKNKASTTDFRPETLAEDYLKTYVTNASKNYTEANKKRALEAFLKRVK